VGDTLTQIIFQDAGQSLTPWLSIAEMLTDPIRHLPRSVRDEQVDDALRSVGLDPAMRSARPRDLSGGQQQRVVIARAVVASPSLLLCDEPTSALDATVARSVLDLLEDARRRTGTTMVFVTHDLAVARLVADRIAVMRHGRLLEVIDSDDLLRSTCAYTRLLLSSVPGSQVSGVGDFESIAESSAPAARSLRCSGVTGAGVGT
jgi:peptide/nickel transport system ATP-binding protein